LNSAEKMWLAGFSAEFLLSQPKLNKTFGWGVYPSVCQNYCILSQASNIGLGLHVYSQLKQI